MTKQKTKYVEASIDTMVKIGLKNSKGEIYKRETLVKDRHKWKKDKKSRHNYSKSGNLKMKISEFDKFMDEYKKKILEEFIKKNDITKTNKNLDIKKDALEKINKNLDIKKQELEDINKQCESSLNRYEVLESAGVDKINFLKRKYNYLKINKETYESEVAQLVKKTREITSKNKNLEETREDLEKKMKKNEVAFKKRIHDIDSYKKTYFQSKNIAETEETKLKVLKENVRKYEEEVFSKKNKKSELENDISNLEKIKKSLENDYKLYVNASENLDFLNLKLVKTKDKLQKYNILSKIKATIYYLIKPIIFLVLFFTLFPLVINLYSTIKEIDFNFTKNKTEILDTSEMSKKEQLNNYNYLEKGLIFYQDTVTIPIKTKTYNNINDKDKWYFTNKEITGTVEDIITEKNNKYVKLKNIIPYFKYDLDK
ncbi:MAG: hypothetical protein B6I28_05780 [Fusobacteriia bacterium 4572_132]|nr:MAG: hypothetical protein B6I28_05780 [Fusobacteriia bacterium 4572_132]